MASNQRYFKVHPLLIDSSRLRFSQACGEFKLDSFNAAARADKVLSIQLQARIELTNEREQANSNYIAKFISSTKKQNLVQLPLKTIARLLQRSPNAPNTLPAISLAAA
jgi:hypothetical protein